VQEARYMRLISWTLRSEQFIYNLEAGKEDNADLDQGNWRQLKGMDQSATGKNIYIEDM
jgi:hypothetical protein